MGLLSIGLALAVLAGVPPARGGSSTDAIGQETVTATVPMGESIHLDVSASGCDNSPGPYITLTGGLALSGLGVELIFQNNAKGTHTYTVTTTATAVLIPAGTSLTIPKQPVQGGVGGNPYIWIQFTDASGNGLSDPVFLGRCVQGLFAADGDFLLPALATADIKGGSCSNTGSTISLSGELALSGVNAKIIFQNADNPVGGPHRNVQQTSASVVLIPAGETITFPKQPSLGGVGGNPWIYLVFLNGNGDPVSDKFLLGRCVQDF